MPGHGGASARQRPRRPRRPAAPPTWRPGPGGRRCARRGSDARPLRASIGIVASRPASAAADAPRPARRRAAPRRRARRPARRRPGRARRTSSCRPASALPRATTPSSPARSAAANAGRVERLGVAGAAGHPQEERAVERAARPADRADQRHPGGLEQRAPAWRVGARRAPATTAVMPRSRLAPWSASPIAESSWVRRSRFAATSSANASSQAAPRRVDHRRHSLRARRTVTRPTAGPASCTGASHSRSSSSSSLSRVTEQPAMSRLVM